MDFVWGKASVKLLSLYTCDDCHSRQAGDSVSIEVEAFSNMRDLTDVIHKTPNRAQNMPVGWSSSSGPKRNHYRCPVCLQKERN
jgi:hypothetical protein